MPYELKNRDCTDQESQPLHGICHIRLKEYFCLKYGAVFDFQPKCRCFK